MKSYVYIIIDPSGLCKIGKANNVKKRLSTLQIGNPRELSIYHRFPCKSSGRARLLELLSHQKLKPFRSSGEWFNIAPESAKITIQDICKQYKGESSIRQNRKKLMKSIKEEGKWA